MFVCGGDKNRDNARSRFLAYAKTRLAEYNILLAEAAGEDFLSEPGLRSINLAKFEAVLAELADCLVIFPESPGSFAEMGFFASKPRLLRKTVAINPIAYQAQGSFLLRGPLALVNRESAFSATLYSTGNDNSTYDQVATVLRDNLKTKRRTHLSAHQWWGFSLKERLFIVFEILRLLRIVHTATLDNVVKAIFGGYVNKKDLSHVVSVLVSTGLTRRAGPDDRYLTVVPGQRTFIDIPQDESILVAANKYLMAEHNALNNDAFHQPQ